MIMKMKPIITQTILVHSMLITPFQQYIIVVHTQGIGHFMTKETIKNLIYNFHHQT